MSAPVVSEATASARRLSIVGPLQPEPPYPVNLKGLVSQGFGRGSKELGIPTANLPEEIAEAFGRQAETGIYYGWAAVGTRPEVLPMVMSFGWNPYYKNEKRSAEVHIIHNYEQDFYGEELRVIVTGYIRSEKNYESLDALIEDINTDIRVAQQSLERPAYAALRADPFITTLPVS
ncbi:riboflavin kinase [Thoreauomyces humboldtii]|nr:riboflavin kinase [Thoreauomyces humboldtii]